MPVAPPRPLTAKQEAFCHAVGRGLTQADAYREAYDVKGMSDAAVYVEASRLMVNPKVALRLRVLRERAQALVEKKFDITIERVASELALLGFSNMQDYMGVTNDGDPYVDLSKLTRERAAALAEFTVEEYTEGRGEHARDIKRVKIKLADKRAALVDVGKYLGMFREPEGGQPGTNATQVNLNVTLVQAPSRP